MTQESNTAADPGYKAVRDFLLYGLTLPERTLRSTVAVVGGTIRESTALLVPGAFRSSKTYSIFVEQMLDFVVEDVGGVKSEKEEGEERQSKKVDDYVARKAVGNFVELAGMATLHLSPMTMLAIVSDVAYGSQVYLRELSNELKQRGVIDENTTIDHATDLLDAVGAASAKTADTFDTPPLSIDGLRSAIDETTQAVTKIDPSKLLPEAELNRMWTDMQSVAEKEEMGMLEVSGAMTMYTLDKVGAVGEGAISTFVVANTLLDEHVFDHYPRRFGSHQRQGHLPVSSRLEQTLCRGCLAEFLDW